MAKRKKPTRSKRLFLECRKLCREIVFERDGHRCVKCGGQYGKVLQWCHVIRQSQDRRLQIDPVNSLVLCKECHRWWHADEALAMLWFSANWKERADYLYARRLRNRGKGTINIAEMESILEELENWEQ